MGYAATDIVLYGVEISEDVAQKIFENELNEDYEFSQPDDSFFYRQVLEHSRERYPQRQPVSPYKAHCSGIGSSVFYLDLLSDGTDSRIETNKFDPGYNHFFGIYIASKGYAYSDDIKYFIRNTPKEAVELFNRLALPILQKYGVEDISPDIQLVNQVW